MSDDPAASVDTPEDRQESERGKERRDLGGWLRAITGGMKDTWDDVLSEGREGAQRTHTAKWAKFEAKRKRGR